MSITHRTHHLDQLAAVPIFSGLTPRQLEVIDRRATTLDLQPGFVITREGAASKEMVVVLDGEVIVEHDGRFVARLGPGDVVGEVGVLARHPRTATATVTAPSRVLHLDVRAFDDIVAEVPEVAQRLLPVVAGRAAQLTERDRSEGT